MKQTGQSLSHAGPSLLKVAVVYTVLVVAGVIPAFLLKQGAATVNPYGSQESAEAARRFFADNSVALRVSSFFLFASSIPLGIYAATVVSRLHFLGVRAAGSYIALFGGFAASMSLAIAGFSLWVLSVPEVSGSLPVTRAMHFLTFLFGGVGFAAAFGLLAAGVSVTGYFFQLLPRWLVRVGIAIAAAGELASVSLLTGWATPLIPIVRVGGFVWLIAVGATLPQSVTAVPNAKGNVIEEGAGFRHEAA